MATFVRNKNRATIRAGVFGQADRAGEQVGKQVGKQAGSRSESRPENKPANRPENRLENRLVNYRGGVEATRILLQRGHRRIACIQGVPHSMPNRRRVQGYLDALRQAGLQEEAIITGDAFSLENGYRQTKLAVAGPDRPTAIFALSNTILLGAVKAIRESGLRIPEDISVVSFDDNPYLDFLVPAITRIGQPVEEIGKTAVRLLLESIREEVRCRTQLQLPPERIVRDSVANPRTAK